MTLSFSAACTRIITATSACSFREPQKKMPGGTQCQPRTKQGLCPVLPGWMFTVSATPSHSIWIMKNQTSEQQITLQPYNCSGFLDQKFHIALSLSIYSFSTLIVNYTGRTNTQVSFRNFALLAKYACWLFFCWPVSCGFLTQAPLGVNSRQRHKHMFSTLFLVTVFCQWLSF